MIMPRLYSKQPKTFEDLIEYSASCGELWIEIESFLADTYDLKKIVHNSGREGWGVNYKHGKKQICDIHAEIDAFVVFFHLRSEAIDKIKDDLSEYALEFWVKRYPCGNGGWIRYRVTEKEHLNDVKTLLTAKVKQKK